MLMDIKVGIPNSFVIKNCLSLSTSLQNSLILLISAYWHQVFQIWAKNPIYFLAKCGSPITQDVIMTELLIFICDHCPKPGAV